MNDAHNRTVQTNFAVMKLNIYVYGHKAEVYANGNVTNSEIARNGSKTA